MADERRRRSDSDDSHRQPEGQAVAKPAELKPMQLRNDPAREVTHSTLVSRDTPVVQPVDRASSMMSIEASKFEFQPVNELRPALKREIERNIALQEIPVTTMQMLELRERRIAARDLGWKVPGKRIRIDRNS